MNKWIKRLLGVAAAGAFVAGILHLMNRDKCCDTDDEFAEDFEDEDFDLDEDLEPAKSRGYVSLNPGTEDSAKPEEAKVEEPKAESTAAAEPSTESASAEASEKEE